MNIDILFSQAAALTERGMFRRAAGIYNQIAADPASDESERDSAMSKAASLTAKAAAAAAAQAKQAEDKRQAARREMITRRAAANDGKTPQRPDAALKAALNRRKAA